MKRVLVTGSLNQDVVIRSTYLPQPGETLIGTSVRFEDGGKGANQAVAACRAGALVRMTGSVGVDAAGHELTEHLNTTGVETDQIRRLSKETTGMAFIHVDDLGENSITVIPGANMADDVPKDELVRTWLSDCDCVLLQNEIHPQINKQLIRLAKAEGIMVMVNPAPYHSSVLAWLANIDVLTPNEEELKRLVPEANTRQERMSTLLARGVQLVVVTLGASGIAYMHQDGRHGTLQAPHVQAIDTVGAGDTFCGYLGARLTLGDSLEQALLHAMYAASLSVTRAGTQRAIPSFSEVLRAEKEWIQ